MREPESIAPLSSNLQAQNQHFGGNHNFNTNFNTNSHNTLPSPMKPCMAMLGRASSAPSGIGLGLNTMVGQPMHSDSFQSVPLGQSIGGGLNSGLNSAPINSVQGSMDGQQSFGSSTFNNYGFHTEPSPPSRRFSLPNVTDSLMHGFGDIIEEKPEPFLNGMCEPHKAQDTSMQAVDDGVDDFVPSLYDPFLGTSDFGEDLTRAEFEDLDNIKFDELYSSLCDPNGKGGNDYPMHIKNEPRALSPSTLMRV